MSKILAKNKVILEDIMDTLKKFLKIRKLELCVQKAKILMFNNMEKREKDGNGVIELRR